MNAREFVREQVDARTSSDDPWTGKPILAQEAAKGNHGVAKAAVKNAVDDLVADGELFYWHGLLTATDEASLQAVIEHERNAETPRKILIGKANRALGGEQ